MSPIADDMRAMQVRPASRADRDRVTDLWHRCELTRPWNDPNDDFDRAVAGQTSAVLVGTDAGGVVATAMVGYDGHRGWVYYLATRPERRGENLGRQMMLEAERWLAQAGATKVQLMIRSANAAVIDFYKAVGYELEDVRVVSRWLRKGPT